MARGKQHVSLPLAEKVRRYPNEQHLSNEASRAFNDTYKIQHKLMGAQPAFGAAKAAVEAIPKDRRYRQEGEEVES